MTDTYGYGKLGGFPIEYIGINIEDHYQERGSFIATKILEMAMLMYAQTGNVTYSNHHFIGALGRTRRGIQIAFGILEADGILQRTFSDPETKFNRTGFVLDVEKAIQWLGSTREDVQQLKRGTLFKHFVYQSVIKIKLFAKKLKKAMRISKNKEDRMKAQELMTSINEQQRIYDLHCKAVIRRRERTLRRIEEQYTKEELMSTLRDWLTTLGFKPPDKAKN